ncbi:MAG: helix-turn-helix transcriptional regulator [Atopobiaceae bacterium]|nr:helix-turn-helix transcriptional regulator [Atopobiaceae bacterium]
MKRRLSRKPSGDGIPEFELFTEARERLGISVESAADLIDMTPRGYAFAERWPTCMEVSDAIILAHALGISMKELGDAIDEYIRTMIKLGIIEGHTKG